MFRKEALEHQKWKSTAVLLSSIPSWLVFLLSFLITASFILYVTLGSYTCRETILGEVVMQPHPIILSAIAQNIKKIALVVWAFCLVYG